MYTEEQVEAIHHAHDILQDTGPHPEAILDNNISSSCSSLLSTAFINYFSPSPTLFNLKEQLNRLMYVHGIVDHPIGTIVEFPETGHQMDVGITHRFRVNSQNFVNPKDNIQYSLGPPHSIHYDVKCLLLSDKNTGELVLCKQTKLSCHSIKKCSFNSIGGQQTPSATPPLNATGEVFMKTLGFFCALQEYGCAFDKTSKINADNDNIDADEIEDSLSNHLSRMLDWIAILKDIHVYSCEYYMKGQHNHLRIQNINEFDIEYLSALFNNNMTEILLHENAAADKGYGPLTPSMWHQDAHGILQRGTMVSINDCKSHVEIYEPNNLNDCPYVLIVCRNPHTHLQPTCTKTPATIHKIFNLLLEPLEWQLADATSHHILLDNMFIYGLRKLLRWSDFHDPGLGNLHPSLVNYDHSQRLINELHNKRYPKGTGLEGAKHLLEQSLVLPPEQQYLRCVKTYDDPKEGKFHIVICMFKAMTIVIAQQDTGQEIQFRHIHGSGIDTITADGHRGQALEQDVWSAMMSLASSEASANYDKVIDTICTGGKKALDWLGDKESNDAFTLAAIYQPLSKILSKVWKAAPLTSNGNEQAHRNIN
ncbi:hypothetical protein Clacol_005829 [Clathrus columnatus]|uniref:Uncharacterized protein n=1 Tax=Clathrus columnatus TaxID=1419009 RepID=A0AAV5AAF7_9AGAM|nr:hypothetical protein Clacol_005829 [Clathrus columnatus]